jgi:hypothetical protein
MLDEFYYQVQLLNQIFLSIYDLMHYENIKFDKVRFENIKKLLVIILAFLKLLLHLMHIIFNGITFFTYFFIFLL